MKHFKKHNIKKLGFALSEVLLAIAVVVIVGITVYPIYENSRQNAKDQNLANELMLLDQYVKQKYSSSSNGAVFTDNSETFMQQFNEATGSNLPTDPNQFQIRSGDYQPNGYYEIHFNADIIEPKGCISFLNNIAGTYGAILLMDTESNGGAAGGVLKSDLPKDAYDGNAIIPWNPQDSGSCSYLSLANAPSYATSVQVWLLNPIK